MDLFILIRIIPEVPAFPPAWLNEIGSKDIITFDIDVHSSPEILQVARKAIEQADRVVSLVSVEDETQETGRLMGIFKELLRKKEAFLWLQSGSHENLVQLGKKAVIRRQILETDDILPHIQDFLK